MAVGAASTAGFAASQSLLLAACCRVICGLCAGTAWVACCKLVARFPHATHANLMGSLVAIGFVGGLVAQAPFEALVDWLGWRQAFLVMAGTWALLGLLTLLPLLEASVQD